MDRNAPQKLTATPIMTSNETKTDKPATPWWPRLALLTIVVGVGWFWVLQPALRISRVEPSAKALENDQSPLPPKGLIRRIKTYKEALHSPVLRAMLQGRIQRTVVKYINARRIERTFEGSMRSTTLPQWQARFQRWHHVLRKLEEMLPELHIDSYRTYLYLQAGMFDNLLKTARGLDPTPPRKRILALRRLWLAHAAFWCGEFTLAKRLYDSFFAALKRQPQWDERRPDNWRLPSEISTSLYHIGLLQLFQRQPIQALDSFRLLERRWRTLRRNTKHSSSVYFARLLCAEAARQAGRPQESHKWLTRAKTFSRDNTLAIELQARYSGMTYRKTGASDQRHQHVLLLNALAGRSRRHFHSYTDTQTLAQLRLARLALQQKQTKAALARLRKIFKLLHTRPHPSTTSVLFSRNTFPRRFLPATPDEFGALRKMLATYTDATATKPPTPRKTPKPTSKPTTQAASKPAVQATSKPTPKPTTASSQLTPRKLWVSLGLMQALARLKWQEWEKAEDLLKEILQRMGQERWAKQAHLYLGMIYTDQRRFVRAARHLTLYYRAFPRDLRGRVYLGHALWMRRRFRDAKRILAPMAASPRWTKAVGRLLPTAKDRKQWKKMRPKVGFWWRLLGASGWLTQRDPYLSRRSLFWSQYPYIRRSMSVQQIFHALRTSHLQGRFGLLTMLARHRLQGLLIQQRPGANKQPKAIAKAYQTTMKRWRKLLRLYHRMPHLAYILDRALYSHKWGTFALGFF